MERDLEYSDSRGQTGNFNSHAHVERDLATNFWECDYNDFNSHAHVERDLTVFTVKSQSSISTHTLTWSVTAQTVAQCYNHCISTHTLTWSVT